MLTRAHVLAYRVAAHHLEQPAGDPLRDGVLLAGVQDVPPGRTAAVALRVRGARVDPARLVLVHSVRAVPHLHRDTDVACFAAALRPLAATERAKEHLGPFGQQLADHDITLTRAVDQVADAMRRHLAPALHGTPADRHRPTLRHPQRRRPQSHLQTRRPAHRTRRPTRRNPVRPVGTITD